MITDGFNPVFSLTLYIKYFPSLTALQKDQAHPTISDICTRIYLILLYFFAKHFQLFTHNLCHNNQPFK